MDYQTGIVSAYAKDKDQDLLVRAARVLNQARNAGITVIYVQVGFRPKFPEISPRNASFSTVKTGKVPAALQRRWQHNVVTKHRVGAFAGTDLDMILRAKDIDTLILFGISTSGVVLSTLRYAADADYRLIVIKDCCADMDAEVPACLVDKVFRVKPP
jgi:nicotinamidase-related amidase